MTTQVADAIESVLDPRGVLVVVDRLVMFPQTLMVMRELLIQAVVAVRLDLIRLHIQAGWGVRA